jgi:hypothetical protein|tara:strand:+ start:4000 stop:5139 length:1140 start_codon:yes stop_codon:yes gene_type:complete
MANIPIYNGSPSWATGLTPFGFYDNDPDFPTDAVKVAKFCAQRLGYPLTDVELQDMSFFTAFEEAVTVYGNELYSYQIRDNQLTLEGLSTGSNLNTSIITPSFEPIVRLTEMYGAEAGTGGNVTYYTGSFPLTASKQTYDLKEWAVNQGITGSIEVKKVFYESSPAINKIYDPYLGNGLNLMNSFGFGGMSPGIGAFMMMPTNLTIASIQAIEISEQVRRSNYSFELKNNNLTIFPVPITGSGNFRFEYINRKERISGSATNTPSQVTNVSNSPYSNPSYAGINSVGRQWIFEYSLAISKEMLGYVRGKYSNIPIPDASVTLNQSDLIAAATSEKASLIERLRAYFDETSRKSLLERRSQEAEFKQTELKQVPYTIYIG